MNNDLISRSALLAELEKLEARSNDPKIAQGIDDGLHYYMPRILEDFPSVDAVEVVWKPICGFEGLYEVSSFGQVRNKKGEILKQSIKRKNCTCYKAVCLYKDGKGYGKYIHRLIAEAFIPNPDNLPMINHKDEDGTNNLLSNLEWCTREYNVNYGTGKERRAKKIRGRESEKRVPVIQRNLDGEFINWHPSITEAAKSVNSRPQAISAVCNGKRKTHRGYVWEFDKNDFCSYGERREDG